MADNPVAGGHHQGWRRTLDCRLLAELSDEIARVDGMPDGLLEALYAIPGDRRGDAAGASSG